jgi:2-polyprenyl-6-methoxyphenol hydroxylase-like FAD-dependent oxidoreductase
MIGRSLLETGRSNRESGAATVESNRMLDSKSTTCVVAGGGPAGVVLSYVLARNGVDVTLLEMHHDFDRDFRGDSLHPSILEVMDELGLAERLLQLPHTKLSKLAGQTPMGQVEVGDLSRLKTKFPFIAFMPQARFLEFVTSEAKRFSCFHLIMGATVEELLEKEDVVKGVRYRARDGWHELRALLTVGTDGRFSRVRKLSGLDRTAIKTAPSLDVLWFRLSRRADDPHGVLGRLNRGHFLIAAERGEQWQLGMSIPKNSFPQLRAAGMEELRQEIVKTAPEFGDRVHELQDWNQVSVLSVQADRLRQWYKPGLLLIGDAAHVMSPVGGNGINYAIMDAVAAANFLTEPLKSGTLSVHDLDRVQKRRERPTRIIQGIVGIVQGRLLSRALDPAKPFELPSFLRRPGFGRFVARVVGAGNVIPRVVAFGFSPEHIQTKADA